MKKFSESLVVWIIFYTFVVCYTDEGAERIARGAVVFPRQTDSLPETADTICRVYHQDKFLMLGQVRELDKGGLGLFVYKNFR